MLDIGSRTSASVEVFYGVRGVACSDLPIHDAARQIVDAGFGAEVLLVDFWGVPGAISEDTIERLTEVCQAARFITTHACINKWSPEAVREEILTAARIGIPLMIVHPYVLGLDEPEFRPVDQEIRDLCKFALDNGVTLALENLGKTGIGSLRQALDIVGTDPANTGLGICIDIGHANRSCTDDGIRPEVFLKEFAELILEVHVDDNFGADDLHLPPGQGSIDWPPVVEAIRSLRDDVVVCLEIAAPEAPLETLHASRDFLLTTGTPELVTRNL